MSETVWITLIIVGGIVVVVTLWLGRRLRVARNADGDLSLEVDNENSDRESKPDIKVAENLEFSNGKAGDVAGVKTTSGKAPQDETGNIEVAKNARFKNAEVGDIAGVKINSTRKDS